MLRCDNASVQFVCERSLACTRSVQVTRPRHMNCLDEREDVHLKSYLESGHPDDSILTLSCTGHRFMGM